MNEALQAGAYGPSPHPRRSWCHVAPVLLNLHSGHHNHRYYGTNVSEDSEDLGFGLSDSAEGKSRNRGTSTLPKSLTPVVPRSGIGKATMVRTLMQALHLCTQ